MPTRVSVVRRSQARSARVAGRATFGLVSRAQRAVVQAARRAGPAFLDAFGGARVAVVGAAERVALAAREARGHRRPGQHSARRFVRRTLPGLVHRLESSAGAVVRRPHPAVLGAVIAGTVSFGVCFALGARADRTSASRLAASQHSAGDQRPRVALGEAPPLRVREALLQPVVVAPAPRRAAPEPASAQPAPAAPVTTTPSTTTTPQATAPQTTTPAPQPTTPTPAPRATPAPKPATKPRPQTKPAPKKVAPPDFDSTGPPAPQSGGSG
jgi:hypothetical protein